MEGLNRWQQEELFKGIAGLFTPETRSDLTAEENRLIKLCCKGSSFKDEKDDEFAEQLDMLLTAAKARGKPLNLKITSTSGATLLVMAALSNGVERVRVLLKHGADPNDLTPQQETAVHIGARYGYLEVLRLVLESGGNPLLLDCHGNSPLTLAQLPHDPMSKRPGSAPKKQIVAVLKEHVAKYQNHLRQRPSKAKASSSRAQSAPAPAGPSDSATTATQPPAAADNKNACDYCCKVPEDKKIQKCAQCGLRAYCSRECQKADWPTHKFPCSQVADVKGRVKQLLDKALGPGERMYRARTVGDNIELQKVALNTKVVAQLVAALESDEPIQDGWLPALIAVTGMMRDLEAPKLPYGPDNPTVALHPVAVEQFIAAGGPVALLKAVARRDVCDEQQIEGLRCLSGVVRLWQAAKPLVTKGVATQVVQLMGPFVQHTNSRVLTNAAFCLSQLLRTEQQLIKRQQQQQQQEQQSGTSSDQEVAPVVAAVLQHVDLMRFASPMGHMPRACHGNFYQACMEFFPALLATRAAYKALQSQQPVLFTQLLDNSVNGMALADPQAWAASLELLHLYYRHGGVGVLAKELRPVLLRYEEDFEEARGPDDVSGVFDIADLKPGQQMICRAMFVSCLLDALEHEQEQVQLVTIHVKVWRVAALLLRAIWDAVPEMRGLYADFTQRIGDVIKYKSRGAKDQEVLKNLMMRIMANYSCKTSGRAFMEQKEYLAVVKHDPSAASVLSGYLTRAQAPRK